MWKWAIVYIFQGFHCFHKTDYFGPHSKHFQNTFKFDNVTTVFEHRSYTIVGAGSVTARVEHLIRAERGGRLNNHEKMPNEENIQIYKNF